MRSSLIAIGAALLVTLLLIGYGSVRNRSVARPEPTTRKRLVHADPAVAARSRLPGPGVVAGAHEEPEARENAVLDLGGAHVGEDGESPEQQLHEALDAARTADDPTDDLSRAADALTVLRSQGAPSFKALERLYDEVETEVRTPR